MAMEHIVRHTCRFNVKNPQHKRINEVLANLNTEVCKSKSQFMIDAIDFYINNFGKESFMTVKKKPIEYVTREELNELEEKIIREAVIAAKDEMLRISLGVKEEKVFQSYVSEQPQELSKLDEEIMDDEVISNLAMSYL